MKPLLVLIYRPVDEKLGAMNKSNDDHDLQACRSFHYETVQAVWRDLGDGDDSVDEAGGPC